MPKSFLTNKSNVKEYRQYNGKFFAVSESSLAIKAKR